MNRKCLPFIPSGRINLPPSKSYTHRALLAATLANGTSILSPYRMSDDILATQEAISSLGAHCLSGNRCLAVTGGRFRKKPHTIFCRESGSTLRFLIPVLAALGVTTTYHGTGRLPSRPISPYIPPLQANGDSFSGKMLPFTVSGQLQPGNYSIAGNISSQFITGLLLALPLLSDDSQITILNPLESAPYVHMTLELLSQFGILIHQTETGFLVPGNQQYRPCNYPIEGDASQASCFAILGCLGSNPITLSGLSPNSAQGDQILFSLLEDCGASVCWKNNDLTIHPAQTISPFTFDISQCPDLAPAVALLGCLCQGRSKITGCQRLRLKESDRFSTIVAALTSIGGKLQKADDCIVIDGINSFSGGIANSFGDHRIVMALSVAAAFSSAPIIISHAEAIEKSYPDFYQDYHTLGGISHVINLP